MKSCFCLKLFVAVLMLLLGGCGSLTGIPGHGGGKRFAVEQELVAAATRATIKKIDLSTLYGKRVNLYVSAIGDTGSGNLFGGRYSLVSQVRGDYIQSPPVIENSTFRRYTSTTSNTTSGNNSSAGVTGTSSSSSRSTTESVLAIPEGKKSQTDGSGSEIQVGLEYQGLGSYKNSEEITSDDLQYLSGLLQSYLFLQGVIVVPPSEAEVDVYVTVDVFGTVRTRIEWFLANNEVLRAKTALEVMAIDHQSGALIMEPQSASVEAEYNEQYILWAGPVKITKYLKPSAPLLSDFSNLPQKQNDPEFPEQDVNLPYPFRHQIEKWMEEE